MLYEVITEHAVDGVYIHNGPEILEPYLMERELLYYTTDYHWSALGAYYGLKGIRSDMGLPSIGYNDYDYTVYDCYVGHGNLDNPAARSKTDRLEVMHMLFPVLGSYHRITSYNVCYTKLLRCLVVAKFPSGKSCLIPSSVARTSPSSSVSSCRTARKPSLSASSTVLSMRNNFV